MTQDIRAALKSLDVAWQQLHAAQKALVAATPGTKTHRNREESYAKYEARLDDVRRSFGWAGEISKTPYRERVSDL